MMDIYNYFKSSALLDEELFNKYDPILKKVKKGDPLDDDDLDVMKEVGQRLRRNASNWKMVIERLQNLTQETQLASSR